MPSYHLSQTIGHAGKAGPHAGYILRIGDYAPGGSKGKGLEDLEATGSGNMPAWAAANPSHFWQAADLGEVATGVSVRPLLDEKGRPLRGEDGKVIKVQQKNRGQAYKEVEVALPRELNAAQRLALVQDWIDQEVGDRHAYTFAVHVPKAKIEGGDQPHLHLMYSERLLDEIARDPDQYFRRYRPKNLEKGGCQKASSGKTAEQNKDELKLRRERWAVLQNRHLEAAGFHEQVDRRSNAARGIVEVPERHLGPRAFDRQRAEVLAERQVKALVRVAKAELHQADIELEMALQAQAEGNWIAAEEQAEADDRARVERECQVIEREQAQEAEAAAQVELIRRVQAARDLISAALSRQAPAAQEPPPSPEPLSPIPESENYQEENEDDEPGPPPAPGM